MNPEEMTPEENRQSVLDVQKALNPNLMSGDDPKPQEKPKESASQAPASDKKETQEPSKKEEPAQGEKTKAQTEPTQEDAPQNFEELYRQLLKEVEVKDKRAEHNQRQARQAASSLSNIKRHVHRLVEEGLDEETAQSILEIAHKNVDPDIILAPEQSGKKEKLPEHIAQWEALIAKAREPLEKYLELSPHAESDNKKAQGFDSHIHLISDEERKALYDTLKPYLDSPRDLLKAMLEIGDTFWSSSLGKGLAEHGSLISIIDAQAETIHQLNEKVEKLEKKEKKSEEQDKALTEKTVTPPADVLLPSDDIARVRNRYKAQGISDEDIDILLKSQ
jgi:hypothetical protein